MEGWGRIVYTNLVTQKRSMSMNGFPNYNVGSRSTKRTDTVKKKQGLGAVYMKEDRSTTKILEGGSS